MSAIRAPKHSAVKLVSNELLLTYWTAIPGRGRSDKKVTGHCKRDEECMAAKIETFRGVKRNSYAKEFGDSGY